MHLKDLWDAFVAKAHADHQVMASAYDAHIAELSEDLGDLYNPQEYPKWVGATLVQNAEEEAALTASATAAAPESSTPVDPDVPQEPASPEGGAQ